MTEPAITETMLQELGKLDTPTICNALEVVAEQHRWRGFTQLPLVCARPDLPPMVGFAKTATIRSTEPGLGAPAERKARRMRYFEYVDRGPRPKISVIQDLDGARAGFGAFWGEVNSNIHRALGCLGTVTDGGVRDIPQLAPGFQALARAVVPSHAYVEIHGFGEEIVVGGMVVRDGDLVHADRHGAVTIPKDQIAAVLAAAEKLTRREATILEACRRSDFSLAVLKDAIARADSYH
ncbi:MAG: RraA family protein [Alphaproteobacteria bacterium]|nr:RraA family protein [Alphaproteobacteria bacterium]